MRSTLAGIEVANGGNRGRRESGDYISVEVRTLDKNAIYKILPLTKYMNASGFRVSKGSIFQLDSKMKYQINGKYCNSQVVISKNFNNGALYATS